MSVAEVFIKGSVAEDKEKKYTFLIHRIQWFLVGHLQQVWLEGLEPVQYYLGRACGRDLEIVRVYTKSSMAAKQETRQSISKHEYGMFRCYCKS